MTVTCSRPSCGAAADDAETALSLRWQHPREGYWICPVCNALDGAALCLRHLLRRAPPHVGLDAYQHMAARVAPRRSSHLRAGESAALDHRPRSRAARLTAIDASSSTTAPPSAALHAGQTQ